MEAVVNGERDTQYVCLWRHVSVIYVLNLKVYGIILSLRFVSVGSKATWMREPERTASLL